MEAAIMKIITLGRSGLEVSRIAFGTWQLGGEWGRFDEDTAVAAIRRARELGVNFFDTAQAYGFGCRSVCSAGRCATNSPITGTSS
jgi:aryl-alcohol dehydrogenase-like predicted oxidoreductase